ncbi:MAG: hypothetical protein ABIL58_18110 [Pseudomonadota bacterium]
MMSTSVLMWGLLYGSIGLGLFIYGKKQGAMIPLLCGIGLMVLPYLITNVYILAISGAVLVIAPFVIKI